MSTVSRFYVETSSETVTGLDAIGGVFGDFGVDDWTRLLTKAMPRNEEQIRAWTPSQEKKFAENFIALLGRPSKEWIAFVDESNLPLEPFTGTSDLALGNVQGWAQTAHGIVTAHKIRSTNKRWGTNPAEAMLEELASKIGFDSAAHWVPVFAKSGRVTLRRERLEYIPLVDPRAIRRSIDQEIERQINRLCLDTHTTVRAKVKANGSVRLTIDQSSFGGAVVAGLMTIIGEKNELEPKLCGVEGCSKPIGPGLRETCSPEHSKEYADTYYSQRRPKQNRQSTGNPIGRPPKAANVAKRNPQDDGTSQKALS
jgi:hypothetical protein